MPVISPLRSLAASTVALAVATTAGVAIASSPSQVVTAVPAAAASPTPIEVHELSEREALANSRAAERAALNASVVLAAADRAQALTQQVDEISAADKALQEKKAAEEKAAADKAAADKAAAEKASADKASAEKASAEKASGEKSKSSSKSEAASTTTSAPSTKTPSGSPKEIARQLAKSIYGWGDDQFQCYDNIIMRESLWDPFADNPTSSAYGIPQALPGSKMASEGADWRTNPATQIKWGLKYVKERYGSPCSAWSFKRAHGWY